VTVNLLNSTGTVIQTTATNAGGNYQFTLLPPADYAIQVVLPAGYQFSQRDAAMGFAECLGVIISMKDRTAFEDAQYERWLRHNCKHPCFDQVIPRATSLQTAAHFCPRPRSYWAKYPGETGKALRQLAAELLVRNSAAMTRKALQEGRAAE
jgi:hypothetical protein